MLATSLNVKQYQDYNDTLAPIDQYYSVEFSVEGLYYLHQFKLWHMAESSMCVLVREDSEILGFLNVGDIIKMKFYRMDNLPSTDLLDTEIRLITKEEQGRYKGHYIIGLAIQPPESGQSQNLN
ncbi:MAG: hypothetical protein JRJ85_17270 [Deltaproteobacteria bacterium]|nr:hypothetical protein [Deltaproteobacteria bacterium]